MKISLRILLINFLIVVLILGSSFLVFYNVVYDVLTSSQTRSLRQSANNFIYVYRTLESETEEDFASIYDQNINKFLDGPTLQLKNIDFILELNKDGLVSKYLTKNFIFLPDKNFTLKDFQNYNPYSMTSSVSTSDGIRYVYGRMITNDLLNDISQRINSDIALIWNGYPADFSNQSTNQKNLYVLTQAIDNLRNKNNFEVYTQGTESEDILATIYKPAKLTEHNGLEFLVFSTFAEAGELRNTLQSIFIIIGVVGIALSLIFSMVFTDKLRKQITELSKATEETYEGKFDYKIDVKSKDEIGKLGVAFNKMLDELKKKEIARNEYAEFITLINQNPSLKEISDVALKKIIDAGDFLIGGLYDVDEKITLISSYGLDTESSVNPNIQNFIKKVLETKKTFELYDDQELPVVSTGLLDIKIKYLLFLPIVYNDKSVALLELGSLAKPREEVRDYLEKIKDQLAIGITNARALFQLERLVGELKKLNDNYQKQNVHIKVQNDELIQLHGELKEQAEELEKQRQKALELTDAKSRFLANMSHELRTPMNSILGLTELMLEKVDLEPRNKERLEVILNSGKRLMTLINDILDLSKIEAGKIDILQESVHIEEIITEVSTPISLLAKEKKISYVVESKLDTKKIIKTDRGKVVQVLINLLGNAVKYTDEGEVILRVAFDKGTLNFEVIDTGIGISDEEVNVIFEEFRQSNSSNSRKRGGTGLGLTICRKLAVVLEGELKVKSKLNEGSTFTFSIPFVPGKQSAQEKTIISENTNNTINDEKKSVLLIDFKDESASIAKKHILSSDYELVFIENSAIDFPGIADLQPVAILQNLDLTDEKSWDIVSLFKQNVQTLNIPLMLLAFSDKKDSVYVIGAADYMLKPISYEELSHAFLRLENSGSKNIQRVLIIDNDLGELENNAQLISSKGIEVISVSQSEEALNKIKSTKPDVIIINIAMPGVDGISLNYMLKSNSETSHIPVILTVQSELELKSKELLTKVIKSITQNLNQKISETFKYINERLKSSGDLNYAVSVKENINVKLEIAKNNLSEIKPAVSENSELDIMIVDDDPNTLFTLAEIVQSYHCNPIVAHSGKECLELLEIKTPDLILLDIIMPEMDGFKTISKIKSNKKWSDIPVFAVTAKAMKEDNEIILKHGFTDYIPKPVNPAFVQYKIQSLLTQLKTT